MTFPTVDDSWIKEAMDVFSWSLVGLLAVSFVLVVFVAAAEAGLISVSRARVRLMAGQGVNRAEILHSYIQERDSLLRALALARNLAIVAVAVLAASLLTRERGHDWGLIVAIVVGSLGLITLLEVVPRALVARNPENWGLRLAPVIGGFKLMFGGVARVLNLPTRVVARGAPEDEEDILRMLDLEESEGPIEEDERKMIRGVFGLEDTTVREIMTPRIDIVAVDTETPTEAAVNLIIDRGLSRVPLYEKNADTIVGIVYAKDLLRYLADGRMPAALRDLARTPFWVPESKRVDELLTEMRRRRTHIAIVVDEYGGTAGLVTIEDLLEEIVGEIEDEYDRVEQQIVQLSDSEILFDGRVAIDELNDLFHTSIKGDEFDTVGGCVFHLLGRMPSVGDEAETGGLRLQVLSVDGHRVGRIRVTIDETQLDETEGGNSHNGKNKDGNGRF